MNAVWHSSAEVGIRVTAQRLTKSEPRHVLSEYFTMVALNADEEPAKMPSLVHGDDEAMRREREANVRRARPSR